MTRRGFLLPAAVVLVFVTFTAGCSDGGMSVTEGRKAAKQARQPVGKTYWKLRSSLVGRVHTTYGTGSFADCADRNIKNSLRYFIDEPFTAKSEQQTEEQLVAMVKSRLSDVGWKLKPAAKNVQSAEKDGIKVQLQSFDKTSGERALGRLYVWGECTNVGQAKGDIVDDYSGSSPDKYESSSASPTPIPTTFPDPHAAPEPLSNFPDWSALPDSGE
jgi:hypothetical protein